MLNKDNKALRKSFCPSEMETVNLRLLSQDPTQLDVAIWEMDLSGGLSQADTLTLISLQFSLLDTFSDYTPVSLLLPLPVCKSFTVISFASLRTHLFIP